MLDFWHKAESRYVLQCTYAHLAIIMHLVVGVLEKWTTAVMTVAMGKVIHASSILLKPQSYLLLMWEQSNPKSKHTHCPYKYNHWSAVDDGCSTVAAKSTLMLLLCCCWIMLLLPHCYNCCCYCSCCLLRHCCSLSLPLVLVLFLLLYLPSLWVKMK